MTRIDRTQPRPQRRMGRDNWLAAGLDLLREGGIEAVRVERLAARLGVAKSGFYYHFRDRADLCNALLDHWVDLDQAPMKALMRHPEATPADRLRLVAEVVDREDLSRFDIAIRLWARQDPKVRRIWRKEMTRRIDLLRGLFADLGFENDDLEMRVRLYVAYHVSERDLFSDLTAAQRAALRERRLRLLLER